MSILERRTGELPIPHTIEAGVVAEIAELAADGYDVRLHDTYDPYALDPQTQAATDAEIRRLEVATKAALDEGLPNPLLLPQGRTAFETWGPLTKRAIALNNIYNAHAETLGEGIDPTVYDRKLFAVGDPEEDVSLSAMEVMQLTLGQEKADKIYGQYQAFVPTVIDQKSRLIWAGAKDGAGVRTRATCAMEEAANHLTSRGAVKESGVVSLSLACGAAAPVYELMAKLQSRGLKVDKSVLADMDPMALASAYSIGESKGVEDKVELKLENLVNMQTGEARDLTEFTEKGSVDVVDLLGIFEYFPRPLAVSLLKEVKKVLSPDGIIVFGNMLDKRPQQTFFSDVSLWPPLQQRSLTEMFSILDEAGFDAKKDARILLPPQGVYAVVSVAPNRQERETHVIETTIPKRSGSIGLAAGPLALDNTTSH